DLNKLSVCRGQRLNRQAYIDIGAEPGQEFTGTAAHFPPVESAPGFSRAVSRREEILGDRKFGEQVELLRDHCDPFSFPSAWRLESDRCPVDLDDTFVRSIEAVHTLDRGAFARSILSCEG